MKEHLKLGLEELKDIIKQSASGDVRAQEKLYRMFAPKMFGVCMRYAKDRTEAEDNLQDGFVNVFTNLKKFRHEGSFEGWVRRIMVNVSLSKYRKQHILYPVEDVGKYETQSFTGNILEKISADELINLIQELPPRYRMVFNLFVMEGLSHQEIGEAMKITEGTSKSNLARARDILKRKVEKLYGKRKTNANYTA
ncbi:RNA polymerase sigma-70 factor, ECF subfamily [Tangfeifania diversioriginum]|uniref:RNA polymerase sigma-70 factor, ECF subfamily n=1 Tax=Tangfeifania diversioriginum TaxID=1168035 RepID=A0A1M6JRU8_9BACT|nr:sigma-70 family RNA polymerase sigma factor [Tangfeifania diversioriginum]SHJ49356.1 RNA polymerase sigma-70 factor, ECF subfamily [Tangfeifania diversioriginum]